MKSQNSANGTAPISEVAPNEGLDLGALFDGHIAREFADQDVDATMETMVPEPYVQCVPTMTGGFGGQGVRCFYSEHFVKPNAQGCRGDTDLTYYWQRLGRG